MTPTDSEKLLYLCQGLITACETTSGYELGTLNSKFRDSIVSIRVHLKLIENSKDTR